VLGFLGGWFLLAGRLSTVALVGLVLAAVGIALLLGYASVRSERSYYAYGEVSARNESVNVVVEPAEIVASSGAQGVNVSFGIRVVKGSDVENVKLLFVLVNVGQLEEYLDYLSIVLNDSSGQVKGVLSFDHPNATVVLDSDDFSGDVCNITGVAYYEVREGALFTRLPLLVEARVLEVS